MLKIKLEAQFSEEDLLEAVTQLSEDKIEKFIQKIIILRAKKSNNNLSNIETNLLLKINQSLDNNINQKWLFLCKKREQEELSKHEYDELLTLTEVIENYQAQRLQYLVKLAKIRKCSLETLMENLEIKPMDNDG